MKQHRLFRKILFEIYFSTKNKKLAIKLVPLDIYLSYQLLDSRPRLITTVNFRCSHWRWNADRTSNNTLHSYIFYNRMAEEVLGKKNCPRIIWVHWILSCFNNGYTTCQNNDNYMKSIIYVFLSNVDKTCRPMIFCSCSLRGWVSCLFFDVFSENRKVGFIIRIIRE